MVDIAFAKKNYWELSYYGRRAKKNRIEGMFLWIFSWHVSGKK
jgi:hypothetical protein